MEYLLPQSSESPIASHGMGGLIIPKIWKKNSEKEKLPRSTIRILLFPPHDWLHHSTILVQLKPNLFYSGKPAVIIYSSFSLHIFL